MRKPSIDTPSPIGRGALWTAAFLLLAAWGLPARAQSPIEAWRRWETSLTSTKTPAYANPYRDVQVQVEFFNSATLPSPGTTPTNTGFAFWDGGTTFKIRAKFPPNSTCPTTPTATSSWWWRTKCAAGSACAGDTGLDGRSGNVTVQCSTSTNILYKNGPVRTSTDATNLRRYLVHDNNTPFFWQGDTAWSAGWRSSASQWSTYIADRAAKKYSVVQISVPMAASVTCPDSQPKDLAGRTPFNVPNPTTEPCDTVNVAYPNDNKGATPAFWRDFESRIQTANANGLLVLLIGLMERTVDKKVTTSGATVNLNAPTLSATQLYVRYLAARLAGNHVIFSPGFDGLPTAAQIASTTSLPSNGTCATSVCSASVPFASLDRACRTRCVGLEINSQIAGLPGRPLVTNHAGGACLGENPCRADSWYEKLQQESWTDFVLFQSGQASADATINSPAQLQLITERGRERPFNLYDRVATPVKPNVNGEAIYAGGGGTYYTADKALQVGYLSVLSGAVGYTVGVGGIWDWTNPTATANLDADASKRTQYMGALWRSLPWQRLQPTPSRIVSQPTDPCPYPPPDLCFSGAAGTCNCVNHHRMRALASDAVGRFALAYLPSGETSLGFDNNGWTNYPSFVFYWFDPRLGCVRTATAPSCAGTICTASTPDSTKDWVFVMKLASVGGTGYPFPSACP